MPLLTAVRVVSWFVTAGVDPSLCKHIELSATTCQGYLHKLGGMQFLFVTITSFTVSLHTIYSRQEELATEMVCTRFCKR